MFDSNPNWLAHCTTITDLAKLLFQNSTIRLEQHALLLITDGQTTLSINGCREHIVFGHLIILERGTLIQLTHVNRLDFSGYLLYFSQYDVTTSTLVTADWANQDGYSIQRIPEAIVTDIRITLAKSHHTLPNTLKQFIFYNLCKEIRQESKTSEYTIEQCLTQTVTYMHQSYHQMITRDELAKIAGYSPWYYSRKFIEHYGQTPIHYLIRYRVFRAQELLLTTTDLSQNIAKKVGFVDAQYFSRQFKRIVGQAPKQFKHNISNYRICFLTQAHAEIAIALGIIPHCVILTNSLTPHYQKTLFTELGITILEMPQYIIQQDIIIQQQPDLIIGIDLTEETKQHFQTIAPVITGIPYDLTTLIHYFGYIFNQEHKATQIIEQLALEVNHLRNKIQPHLPQNPTVLYLRVEQLGYRYIGEESSDVAHLLYAELGLHMPENLRTHKKSFNTCSLQQLTDANPAYLFIEKRVMDYYNADANLAKLKKSRQWAELDAVKNKRVFYVDTGLWINSCSVFGKREIMKQIEHALLTK